MQRPYCVVAVSGGALAVLALCGSAALADPLPGEILKFQQLPLNNGGPVVAPYVGPYIAPNPFPIPGGPPPHPVTPFPGHDEISTATVSARDGNDIPIAWQGQFMADDFADRFTTPVVHVRWWGSYLGNQVFGGVKKFLISFESDIPAGGSVTFSRPGTPLLNQIVSKGPLAPGSGTYTEVPVPTPTGPGLGIPIESLYQYNAELHFDKQFFQLPNTVYWLKIVALVDPLEDGNLVWGWHNRDWGVPDLLASIPPAVVPGEGIIGTVGSPSGPPVWHFQDDAVSGLVSISPGPSPTMPIISQTGFAPQNYINTLDGPEGINLFSKDLAFELYTVPEPAGTTLIGLCAVLLGTIRRRANRR